jgi:hypothetical protein
MISGWLATIFYAFHEAKQGRTEYLVLLEGQVFGALGLDSPTRSNQPCSRGTAN